VCDPTLLAICAGLVTIAVTWALELMKKWPKQVRVLRYLICVICVLVIIANSSSLSDLIYGIALLFLFSNDLILSLNSLTKEVEEE